MIETSGAPLPFWIILAATSGALGFIGLWTVKPWIMLAAALTSFWLTISLMLTLINRVSWGWFTRKKNKRGK